MDMDKDLLTGIIDELQRKDDCADNILQLLQARGLDHLPLDTDVLVTELKNSWPSLIWSMIFAKDKVNALKVLLPPKLSTHLAGNLFMKGYKMKAEKCMMYLLGQVPCYLHAIVPIDKCNKPTFLRFALHEASYRRFMEENEYIHTSNQERVKVLDMFQEENSTTGKTLLEQATPAGCVGETLRTFYFWSFNLELSAHIAHATEVLTKRYKEEVRIYRDQYGSSLLHKQMDCYRQNCPQDVVSSTKQLLSVGIDPTSQDNNGRTALDIIITKICRYACIPEHLMDIQEYIRGIETCLECLQIMLSWFTGAHGDFRIPKLKSNYLSYEALSKDLIQLWHVLLNNNISRVNQMLNECRIIHMVKTRFLVYDSVCRPAAELLYSEMRNGLNFCNPEENFCFSLPYALFRIISGFTDFNSTLRCTCCDDRPAGELKPPCDCCFWSMLELVLNMKPALVKPDSMESSHSVFNEMCQYLDLVTIMRYEGPIDMENISKLVNISWMYFPLSKPIILKKLHTLKKASSDTTSQREIQELQELVQSVRPLQLLTRLCILQNIQWKHIQQLPLPGLLKQYIEIGNVSRNHVIHELI